MPGIVSVNKNGDTEISLNIAADFRGRGGRIAFAAHAAQLVSAPLFRCYASGRLRLDCFVAALLAKTGVEMKMAPTRGPFFIW